MAGARRAWSAWGAWQQGWVHGWRTKHMECMGRLATGLGAWLAHEAYGVHGALGNRAERMAGAQSAWSAWGAWQQG
eukprot:293115-Chlamydomonas_euryale.AAC.1